MRDNSMVGPIDRETLMLSIFFVSSSFFLSRKNKKTKTGISLRTQELYTLVFVCRYLDLFTRYVENREETRRRGEKERKKENNRSSLFFLLLRSLALSLSLSLDLPPLRSLLSTDLAPNALVSSSSLVLSSSLFRNAPPLSSPSKKNKKQQ